MSDIRKISICIPTYQRFEMLFESFEKVYDDERISEIVIVDDESDLELYDKIREKCFHLSKVRLFRNVNNRDCYENKATSIAYASNDWCILLDSDNIIDKEYLDKLFGIPEWDAKTVYAPTFAKPTFDYRTLCGVYVTKQNAAVLLSSERMFSTALNTANYFVNKSTYLNCWVEGVNPVTADSIFMAYQFISNGNTIYFVPGLEYFHRVHSGSHYQNNNHLTGNFYNDVEEKIKQLR